MRVTQHIKNNIPKFSLYYIGITCINYPLTFTVHIQILLECVYVVFFFSISCMQNYFVLFLGTKSYYSKKLFLYNIYKSLVE